MKLTATLALLLAFSAHSAIINIEVSNFRFTPNDVEIQAGDTVRWTNNQGFHDVIADDFSFSSGPASTSFVFEQTFENVGEVLYHCSVHSSAGQNINAAMNGRINVVSAPVGSDFEINQGVASSWFNPDTNGSGFLIDIRPSDQFMFVAWFTHVFSEDDRGDGDTGTRWFTASGVYSGNTASLDLFQTTGGLFDDPQTVSTEAVGTLNFEFTDCVSGRATYAFTQPEGFDGSFPIQRAVPGTETLCELLQNTEMTE